MRNMNNSKLLLILPHTEFNKESCTKNKTLVKVKEIRIKKYSFPYISTDTKK